MCDSFSAITYRTHFCSAGVPASKRAIQKMPPALDTLSTHIGTRLSHLSGIDAARDFGLLHADRRGIVSLR